MIDEQERKEEDEDNKIVDKISAQVNDGFMTKRQITRRILDEIDLDQDSDIGYGEESDESSESLAE